MNHSHTFQRGSVSLACESWGEGEALVFIHGFGTDRELMRELAAAVVEGQGGYRVVLIDLRGHGVSGAPDDAEGDAAYAYPVQCEDLLALLDSLKLESAHWIGHSMGGQLALMAALRAPERSRSLVALAAGPTRPIVEEREIRSWTVAAQRFEAMSQDDLAAALAAAAPRQDGLAPEAPGGARQVHARARGAELARIVRGAFLPMSDNSQACRESRVPALVIAGDRDTQWLDGSRRLAELLPGAELHEIAGAGHLVHLERVDAVAALIRDFLAARS